MKGGLGKGKNLSDMWTFLTVPVEAIADYYGERISLYFSFLDYFTRELIVISFFGMVTFLLNFSYDSSDIMYKLSITLFTFLIVFW